MSRGANKKAIRISRRTEDMDKVRERLRERCEDKGAIADDDAIEEVALKLLDFFLDCGRCQFYVVETLLGGSTKNVHQMIPVVYGRGFVLSESSSTSLPKETK